MSWVRKGVIISTRRSRTINESIVGLLRIPSEREGSDGLEEGLARRLANR